MWHSLFAGQWIVSDSHECAELQTIEKLSLHRALLCVEEEPA